MGYIKIKNFRGDNLEELSRKLAQSVILYVDAPLLEAKSNILMAQYPELKETIINRLMHKV